jgi:sigma-B regulation protein RsbU (phosphoserine phosphatase)
MATLTGIKGINQGIVIPLESDRILIGRNADCQIVLNLPAVSREHALLRRIDGKWFIEDLKSRNGTFLNNQEITGRVPLKEGDQIKICDNLYVFSEGDFRPPLPPEMRKSVPEEEAEESSSTVEAAVHQSGKRLLETQPAEKLAFLLEVSAELTQTLSVNALLPKIVDQLFQVFRQADRGFLILLEEESNRLLPTVVRTRRPQDEATARFSRKIVSRCLETGEALLSEDALADKRFDLSQSIADYRIRSVMCAPLIGRRTGKAFGVLQLDTQDRAKKFTAEDLKLLLAVAGQAAIALENARLHEHLVARASLERDLRLAHAVQRSFLPQKLPQLAGYEFFAHYESAQEVGGDYYDFIPLPQQKLAVVVGDVAGKGVPAALLMAKLSSDVRFCLLTHTDPAQAVNRLNVLMQEASLLDRFVTLLVAVLNPQQHEVTFVNAGHLPPWVYRRAAGRVEEGTSRDRTGIPLGIADWSYESFTTSLAPGDVIILCTDGVTEAKDQQEQDFGVERTLAVLREGPCTCGAMGQRLLQAVHLHARGRNPHDDLTIVGLGRSAG